MGSNGWFWIKMVFCALRKSDFWYDLKDLESTGETFLLVSSIFHLVLMHYYLLSLMYIINSSVVIVITEISHFDIYCEFCIIVIKNILISVSSVSHFVSCLFYSTLYFPNIVIIFIYLNTLIVIVTIWNYSVQVISTIFILLIINWWIDSIMPLEIHGLIFLFFLIFICLDVGHSFIEDLKISIKFW